MPLWDGSSYTHYAFYGGRAGVKSHATAENLVIKGALEPRRIVCGRQFQNSIAESAKELMEQKIYEHGLGDGYRVLERQIEHVGTGTRITFMGMERNPESAKSLEGCTDFWGEEAQTFSRRSIELIMPTMLRRGNSRMIWTWNPRYPDDPVDAMFRGGEPPENSYIVKTSWRDNPWFYKTRLPQERRRFKKTNPLRYDHVWEGEYDINSDAVIFHNWEIGAIETTEKDLPRFGIDFGYSHDPMAAVKVYYWPSYGEDEIPTVYIAAEAYGTKISNSQMPEFLDQVPEIRSFTSIADSSRPETIDYLRSKGFNVLPSRKGAGSVKNGINWLQGVRIVVNPQCRNVIKELKNYRWKTDREGTVLAVPESGYDHGIDAIRYSLEDDMINDPPAEGEGAFYL